MRRKMVGKTAPACDPRSSPSGALGLSIIVNRSITKGVWLNRRRDCSDEAIPLANCSLGKFAALRERNDSHKGETARNIRETPPRIRQSRPARARILRINYLILQLPRGKEEWQGGAGGGGTRFIEAPRSYLPGEQWPKLRHSAARVWRRSEGRKECEIHRRFPSGRGKIIYTYDHFSGFNARFYVARNYPDGRH